MHASVLLLFLLSAHWMSAEIMNEVKRCTIPLFLAVLVTALFLGSALTAGSILPDKGAYVEVAGDHEFSGRLIVRPVQYIAWVESGFSIENALLRVNAARQIMQNQEMLEYVSQTDEYIVRVPSGETENSLSRLLMNTGLIQYAEPDWTLFPVGDPDDPMFGSQWHHEPDRMQSADGWDIHTGNPTVSVGICDTGVLTTHEDLLLHRLEGYNAVDRKWESQGGDIDPVAGHGTQCTGCAAANSNNGKGVAGVGWNLSHRMLRVSNSSGGGAYLSDLQHAARVSIENGDRVASVSYSGVDNSSNLTTAAYIKSIGGLLVWAAGNDNRNITYGDRDDDDIIVVGATDQSDNKAYFSAYGQFVDLTAPGIYILTTDSDHNSDYASVGGTSFATPLTAGLAAVIWSKDPSLTPDEVETILKQGCDDLGSNGVDNTFGYGRINVYGSLSQGGGSNQPPVAAISASAPSWVAPATVTFDASDSYDPDGTIVLYEWDLDGNGSFETSTGTVPTVDETYGDPGDYTVTVRVTDNDGDLDTEPTTFTVTNGGGSGDWVGAWAVAGNVKIIWRRYEPFTGMAHVLLRENTSRIERVVNLAGATDVYLRFQAKAALLEPGDEAYVKVSADGISYTTLKTFTSADSDSQYHYFEFALPGNMTADYRIVFQGGMADRKDYLFFDDIEIYGVK